MSYVAMFFRYFEISIDESPWNHWDTRMTSPFTVPFRCGDLEGAEQLNTNGTNGQWPNDPMVHVSMFPVPIGNGNKTMGLWAIVNCHWEHGPMEHRSIIHRSIGHANAPLLLQLPHAIIEFIWISPLWLNLN